MAVQVQFRVKHTYLGIIYYIYSIYGWRLRRCKRSGCCTALHNILYIHTNTNERRQPNGSLLELVSPSLKLYAYYIYIMCTGPTCNNIYTSRRRGIKQTNYTQLHHIAQGRTFRDPLHNPEIVYTNINMVGLHRVVGETRVLYYNNYLVDDRSYDVCVTFTAVDRL